MSEPVRSRAPNDAETPADVERLHRAIAREPRDPQDGREPVPWWVWATAVAALFWGGFYLGRFAPSFGTGTHEAFGTRSVEAPPPAESLPEPGAVAALDGSQIYAQRCQSCHQANGQGMPPSFPPLANSRWVNGAPETPVRIVLHGLAGPIEVQGTTYQGAMPAWGPLLSDEEIAAVVSWVRALPGNDAPPVEAALVARLRGETRTAPWTAAELEATATGAAP